MIYKKYIELGFERHDLDDEVEFNQTGYGGFYLKYKLRKGVNIFANSEDLNRPRVYIKNKRETPDYIIELTFDNVVDLLGTRENIFA